MGLVTSSASTNNHNLYFSKDELAKILNLYSKGVSNGEWKDYAIDFNKNNAFFYIFKHSLAAPECILNKSLERKKRKIFYNLKSKNQNKKYENLDQLLTSLNRKIFKILEYPDLPDFIDIFTIFLILEYFEIFGYFKIFEYC